MRATVSKSAPPAFSRQGNAVATTGTVRAAVAPKRYGRALYLAVNIAILIFLLAQVFERRGIDRCGRFRCIGTERLSVALVLATMGRWLLQL